MSEKIKKLITPMIVTAVVIFVFLCLILKPEVPENYASYVSYTASAITVLFVLYERILWRCIPWNRPPVLKKKYDGTLYYIENNEKKTKSIEIIVRQSWLAVSIKTNTDINSSWSITGSIVQEYGENVLYYNYITNPDALTQESNPIQHGSCRMVLNGKNTYLKGKYWTSSKTVGDIEWKESK